MSESDHIEPSADNGQGVTFSEPCNELIAALVKAQAKMTNPPRTRTVKVQTKAGRSYSFKYAPLDTIISHVRKPLTESGLWFIQTLQQDNGKYRLCTRLVHTSGQFVMGEAPLLIDGSGNQAFGSALSYMRRYCLESVLGLCATDDDDANAADGNTIAASKDSGPYLDPRGDAQHDAYVYTLFDAFRTGIKTFTKPEDFLTALAVKVKDSAAWLPPNETAIVYIEEHLEYQVATNKNGRPRSDGLTLGKWCRRLRKLGTPPQAPAATDTAKIFLLVDQIGEIVYETENVDDYAERLSALLEKISNLADLTQLWDNNKEQVKSLPDSRAAHLIEIYDFRRANFATPPHPP